MTARCLRLAHLVAEPADVMSVSLSHVAVCQSPLACVHMCMNVFPEEMDVFQDTKLFSHQTAYPGGTQHLLSGTKLKPPPGKTDQPA